MVKIRSLKLDRRWGKEHRSSQQSFRMFLTQTHRPILHYFLDIFTFAPASWYPWPFDKCPSYFSTNAFANLSKYNTQLLLSISYIVNSSQGLFLGPTSFPLVSFWCSTVLTVFWRAFLGGSGVTSGACPCPVCIDDDRHDLSRTGSTQRPVLGHLVSLLHLHLNYTRQVIHVSYSFGGQFIVMIKEHFCGP